jgi:hypothetical protein
MSGEDVSTKRFKPGLPDFLDTIYQSGKKYTKMAIKLPKVHKIYLMVVKYSK